MSTQPSLITSIDSEHRQVIADLLSEPMVDLLKSSGTPVNEADIAAALLRNDVDIAYPKQEAITGHAAGKVSTTSSTSGSTTTSSSTTSSSTTRASENPAGFDESCFSKLDITARRQ